MNTQNFQHLQEAADAASIIERLAHLQSVCIIISEGCSHVHRRRAYVRARICACARVHLSLKRGVGSEDRKAEHGQLLQE